MDTLVPSPMPAPAVAGSGAAPRPVVLLILDGFGCRDDAPDNAITRADAPNWRRLLATCPHTTIDASELRVGLPEGQMGNSEVGHLNIGAGRVVYQDYTRIDVAIRDGQFARNAALVGAVDTARAGGATLHVLGLLSPGGVHSHERQIAAMVDMAAGAGARVAVHAFLDGRDTPPRSALASLQSMDRVCSRHRDARIASICGRYYAMDRDQRWERVAPAYELLVDGVAPFAAATAEAALEAAYARGESDEFVRPTVVTGADGATQMRDGDVVVFMNFRADRAREMTRALTDRAFDGFARARLPRLAQFVCLTSYGDEFRHLGVAFAPQTITNSFGEYVAGRGLQQLRIAETEKYAHVTYFFNGGSRGRLSGRRAHSGAVAEGRDVRPEARDERRRSDRPARRRDRKRPVRRDRLQLRERRHGGPHRQFRAPRSARSKRSTPASAASSTPRAQARRRDRDHRRPRQRRATCTTTRPARPIPRIR